MIARNTAIVIALLAASTAAQRIADNIVKRDGSRVRAVEVTEATSVQVKYTKGSKESTIPAGQVKEIEWHSPSDNYTRAAATANKGQWANAANLFKEAAGEAKRELVKVEASFRAAQALLDGASTDSALADSAASEFQAFVGANADAFREPSARLGLARALRLKNDGAGAAAALDELESTAGSKGWARIWVARAKCERAQLMIAQSKPAEARTAFQGAVSTIDALLNTGQSSSELTSLKTAAVIGQGETYVAEKSYSQALSFFRRYTGPPLPGKSTAMQAAALAGEGQALYLEAVAKSDPNALRRAQISLAKANILDSSNGATTAKALYYSAKVLIALGPDKEKGSKARAASYFDTVVRHYRATQWAALAQAERTK